MTITNTMRAEALEHLRLRLIDLTNEAAEILRGTGHIRLRARPWLSRLVRSVGVGETATIDDTIDELRMADRGGRRRTVLLPSLAETTA